MDTSPLLWDLKLNALKFQHFAKENITPNLNGLRTVKLQNYLELQNQQGCHGSLVIGSELFFQDCLNLRQFCEDLSQALEFFLLNVHLKKKQ